MKKAEQLVAAGHSIEPARWQETFEVLTGHIAWRFARVEPRRHARELVLELLAGLPRENCWTLAEHAGHTTPGSLQHVLARTKWDAVRDDLRGFVVDHLGTEGVVLVVDETGDLKKGTRTVGVQRQYADTTGRIENSQVVVYLAYSTLRGHVAVDRELYMPSDGLLPLTLHWLGGAVFVDSAEHGRAFPADVHSIGLLGDQQSITREGTPLSRPNPRPIHRP